MRVVRPAGLAGVLFSLGVVGSARAGDPTVAPAGLSLRAEASVTGAATGPSTVHVKATFRNDGPAGLTFFVPEHFAATHFPGWRFVRGDGAAFRPYDAPFQSMWTEGIQGSLVALAPGRTWEVEHEVDLVVPADDGDGLSPLPLEPGRYVVECAYEQRTAQVPFGGPAFELRTKPVPGLFTGRVAAAPGSIDVPRPKAVTLRIDAPRRALPGEPYPVTVVLTNGLDAATTWVGGLQVNVSSKPHGTASARVRLAETCAPLPAAETQTIALASGEVRRFTFDLATFGLARGGEGPASARLATFVEEGLFALDAAFVEAGGATLARSNGLWRYVGPASRPR